MLSHFGLKILSRQRTLPGAFNGQAVCLNIAGMVSMPFDPLKLRLCPQRLPLFDSRKDIFHQVFVFYCFPRRSLPPIFPPIAIPIRHTVNCVLAVRYDAHGSVLGHDFQSPKDSRELGSLIRLPWPGKSLGKIPMWTVSALISCGTSFPKAYRLSPGPK